MVRVAGLLRQHASGMSRRGPDGLTPRETLARIRTRALELMREQSRVWADELKPALAENGIWVGTCADCSEEELAELTGLFDRELYPVLTPLAVGPGQPFPYISGLSLSLVMYVRDPETGEERFARVKVPETLPRYVRVGERGLLLPVEEVIGHCLPWLFPGMEIVGAGRLPRHARRRLRGLRRGRRPPRGGRARGAPPPLRRGRPPRGLLVDLAGPARAPAGGPGRRRRPGLPDRGQARSGRSHGDRGARPARAPRRPVGSGHPAEARSRRTVGATSWRRSGAGTSSSSFRTTRS